LMMICPGKFVSILLNRFTMFVIVISEFEQPLCDR